MERHFEREIERLQEKQITMAHLVEGQVSRALKALASGDVPLAREVIALDRSVNALDTAVDDLCQQMFALSQPVAVDLRRLITSLMVNHQLERVGDIAVNIAERAEPLAWHLEFLSSTRLLEMAEIARIMFSESVDAFVSGDTESARRVLASDDVVDRLGASVFAELVHRMEVTPSLVEAGAHILMLSRHVERLADHATNIAEDVIFLVEAKTVKHGVGG